MKKKTGRNHRRKKLAGPEYSGERAMYNINLAGPTGRKVIYMIYDNMSFTVAEASNV